MSRKPAEPPKPQLLFALDLEPCDRHTEFEGAWPRWYCGACRSATTIVAESKLKKILEAHWADAEAESRQKELAQSKPKAKKINTRFYADLATGASCVSLVAGGIAQVAPELGMALLGISVVALMACVRAMVLHRREKKQDQGS